MQTFLERVINSILAVPSVPLQEVAVILPNRRARRLLLQGLSVANGRQPMFAPQIFPMEEFVSWLSPLNVIDPVIQLMRLYTLTRNFSGDRFEMHNMLSWGTPFLKDISDMDMQLQNVPENLHYYAENAKFEISFGKDELSESERVRIQFNDLLADIYVQYKALLSANSEAYEGMIYRDCAENIGRYAQKLPFQRLIFAGFYALSPSELKIIQFLQNHFQTEIYFDIDPFYCQLENPNKDSGRFSSSQKETSFFILRNCEKLNLDVHDLLFYEHNFASIEKNVQIVATSKNMRQIYTAIQEVERIKSQKMRDSHFDAQDKDSIVDMSDTAVVLADENLLLPFLLSYKTDNVTVNATMGFPFEATPVYALIQQLLAVYESVFALTADKDTDLSFSGELLEQLWSHELLRPLRVCNNFFPTVMRHGQIPNKELFANCSKTQISRQLPSILFRFCTFAESVTTEELYLQLWQAVKGKLQESQRLFDDFLTQDEVMDFAFSKFSVTRLLHDVTISMQGDPDTGLQVMGLLETRMMDFKNIIMLSVNEGVLPKGITYNSLLPFDFKYKFNGQEALPNYLYQDQVYAYHFFRLLQRAENVMLIYNNASDVTLAEKSRFIAQLEYEVKSQQLENVIHITQKSLDFNLSLPARTPFSIPKKPEVMERLSQFTFSASSLQTYIACPLKFYFQHLMKIREERMLSDRLEAYELGTVIHALFKSALDEIMQEDDSARFNSILQKHIDSLDTDICEEICKLQGRESLRQSDLEHGYWLINRKIIEETVLHYLEKAKEELPAALPWRIFANEMKVDIRNYPVRSADGAQEWLVKMTGSLDRVQKNGREVMILDYKTGKVEASHLRVSVKKAEENSPVAVSAALDKIFTDSKYDKLFQLVMYMLMYDHFSKEKPTAVQAGIISTREVNMNHADYIFQSSLFRDSNLLNFKELLSEKLNMLLCKIYDETLPFSQTEDEDKCKMCDYLHLCGRQTATESRM